MLTDYKKPLTIEEQIENLAQNKRVVYHKITKDEAKKALLLNNYINIISPFKYIFAKKDDHKIPIKENNKHVYEKDVDFYEYQNEYNKERSKYVVLFDKISSFEKSFNSIISNIVLVNFDIKDSNNFNRFVDYLKESINNKNEYRRVEKQHMFKEVNCFVDKIKKYNSPYIFFDRLTLSETITIYRLLEYKIQHSTFKLLKSLNCTMGYPNMAQFDEALSRLVQVRNCVYHNNSLTILLRYYKVKTKCLRKSTDTKKFKTLIRHLLNY